MKTRQCVCKRCGSGFEQPIIQGRPVEFCGWRCKYATRKEYAAAMASKRYRAMRAAGVPPKVAQPASHSRNRFEEVMRDAGVDARTVGADQTNSESAKQDSDTSAM